MSTSSTDLAALAPEPPEISFEPGATKKSSFKIFFSALNFCADSFVPVLRISGIALFALHLLQLGVDQYLSYSTELIRQRGNEDLLMIALTAGLELVFGLIWSTFWLLTLAPSALAVSESRPVPKLSAVLPLYFNQLLIEAIRSLAAVLLRVPLLVIPAIIEYIRLTLVPFIVVFDPRYSQGTVDALHHSRILSRRRWILLGFVLLLITLLPWLVQSMIQGDKELWIWENPTITLAASLVGFFINVAGGLLLFAVFLEIVGYRKPPRENEALQD